MRAAATTKSVAEGNFDVSRGLHHFTVGWDKAEAQDGIQTGAITTAR